MIKICKQPLILKEERTERKCMTDFDLIEGKGHLSSFLKGYFFSFPFFKPPI